MTSVMPFGKHKGKRFEEIPRDYFDWMLKQEWLKPQLRREINAFLGNDDADDDWEDEPDNGQLPLHPPEPPRLGFTADELTDLRRVLHAGLRTLALQREPDLGEPARRRLQLLSEKLRKNGLMEPL